MKESTQSEFSRQFVGDRRTERTSWLVAFGAVEDTATRALVVDGVLDRGAAIAHRTYETEMAKRDADTRDLEAMHKGWNDVPETYRNANRAVADSALVKLWDAGWKPAASKGEERPEIAPDMMMKLAETEHSRWMAERLLSGWRPGARDNRLMMHPDLRPWSELPDDTRLRDVDQVRAASHVARVLYPQGFTRR